MFPNAYMLGGRSRVPGQLTEVFGVYSDVQEETGLAKSQGQFHGLETCVATHSPVLSTHSLALREPLLGAMFYCHRLEILNSF